MSVPMNKFRSRALALLSALMLTACVAPSPSPSAAVVLPRIPSPPVSSEPPPPGIFWAKVCKYRQSLQETLNLSLPTFEQCATPATSAPSTQP